jgi:hypothetical protein
MVEGPGVQSIRVYLERNAQCFKGSVQLSGRKEPLLRPLIALSGVGFEQRIGGFGPNFAGKLVKPIHLGLHRPYSRAIPRVLGVGCTPVLVNGEKERLLSWLSWGSSVRSVLR